MLKTEVRRQVFVGLSGGVDSSVSAALLKKQGLAVTGVFIKVWQPDFYDCNWKEDRLDAMRICAKLDIPFYTLDLEKEYKKEVVDYMISEYKIGRTPNPDVMCNKYIKFGAFFDWAIKQGADFVATGHYAQVKLNSNNNKYDLLAGKDKNKDQSYFLWTLNQKHLNKTLFPVGHLEKPEVRKLAKKFDLLTFEKKDSQGLCFIGKVDMAEFLKHFIETKTGQVLNINGETIGEHDGAFLFTLGQRHGFTITNNSPDNSRLFVVAKDLIKNTITVANQPIISDKKTSLILDKVNWTRDEEPSLTKKYQARLRYRQPLEECQLEKKNNQMIIYFTKPEKSPTPGQSVVIYDGEICLGGGIIL